MEDVIKQVNSLISATHSVARLKRHMGKVDKWDLIRLNLVDTVKKIKDQRSELEDVIKNALVNAKVLLPKDNWVKYAESNQYVVYGILASQFASILDRMRKIERSYIKIKNKVKSNRCDGVVGVITDFPPTGNYDHFRAGMVMTSDCFDSIRYKIQDFCKVAIDGKPYGLPKDCVAISIHKDSGCANDSDDD
jgi:effector-binding domain-containing protein